MVTHEIPQKVWVHFNSRAAVMEVEIRKECARTCRMDLPRKWMALKRVTDT